MNDAKKLIVVGAGGHARILMDTAEDAGYTIYGIIDIHYDGQEERILNYPVLGDFSLLNGFDPEKFILALAIGDNSKRATYFNKSHTHDFQIATIIHPTAIVSKNAELDTGVFIGSGAIINAKAKIGKNTIVNTGAIIEHEVDIGNHAHIGPGSRIAGRVRIGDQTFVGIGTSIIDKICVGDNVIIGAGSVILNDIEPDSTVVGVPGKKIK
jgi:sugar O-acyltransferase (sialic acid O-acetyltransferase NeuD family)